MPFLVSIIDTAIGSANAELAKVQSALNEHDISNPEKMLKVQFAVQQFSHFITYTSALLKTVRDLISGIIAKI